MYFDSQAKFSILQAITAAAISQDVIDLGAVTTGGAGTPFNAIQDIGIGETLNIVVNVTTTFTGAATGLAITLESATDVGLTTAVTVHQSVSFLAAALVAGRQLLVSFIPSAPFARYIGLRYTPAGGVFTTGALTAFIAVDVQVNRQYASNFVAV